MPFIVPHKRPQISNNKRFSRYKNVAESEFFVLQQRKSSKKTRGPECRIITRGFHAFNYFYEVAYGQDLEELTNKEWKYITTKFRLPPNLSDSSRRIWMVAHFTQLAMETPDAAEDLRLVFSDDDEEDFEDDDEYPANLPGPNLQTRPSLDHLVDSPVSPVIPPVTPIVAPPSANSALPVIALGTPSAANSANALRKQPPTPQPIISSGSYYRDRDKDQPQQLQQPQLKEEKPVPQQKDLLPVPAPLSTSGTTTNSQQPASTPIKRDRERIIAPNIPPTPTSTVQQPKTSRKKKMGIFRLLGKMRRSGDKEETVSDSEAQIGASRGAPSIRGGKQRGSVMSMGDESLCGAIGTGQHLEKPERKRTVSMLLPGFNKRGNTKNPPVVVGDDSSTDDNGLRKNSLGESGGEQPHPINSGPSKLLPEGGSLKRRVPTVAPSSSGLPAAANSKVQLNFVVGGGARTIVLLLTMINLLFAIVYIMQPSKMALLIGLLGLNAFGALLASRKGALLPLTLADVPHAVGFPAVTIGPGVSVRDLGDTKLVQPLDCAEPLSINGGVVRAHSRDQAMMAEETSYGDASGPPPGHVVRNEPAFTLTKMDDPEAVLQSANCWSASGTEFQVRQLGYKRTAQKAPSDFPFYETLRVEIYQSDLKIDHIAQYLSFPPNPFAPTSSAAAMSSNPNTLASLSTVTNSASGSAAGSVASSPHSGVSKLLNSGNDSAYEEIEGGLERKTSSEGINQQNSNSVNNNNGEEEEAINGIPPWLIINWQIPEYCPANPVFASRKEDGEGYNVVIFCALTPQGRKAAREMTSNAAKLLKVYMEADGDRTTRNRLKCIPRILNAEELNVGSALQKAITTYNAKPFLTGPDSHRFYSPENGKYMEVDIDVHLFCYLARRAAFGFLPTLGSLLLDIALTVEGQNDSELPEQVLCSARLGRVDVTQAKPLW